MYPALRKFTIGLTLCLIHALAGELLTTNNLSAAERVLKDERQTPDLGQAFALYLIHSYQNDSGKNSIHRCPFKLSCSYYAEMTISRYGLFPGLVVFLDRYYYREHAAARHLYPRVVASDGLLLLDDTGYLPEQSGLEPTFSTTYSVQSVHPALSLMTTRRALVGDSSTAWADGLFQNGDWEYAAYAYRQAAFGMGNRELSNRITYQVARCYLASGKYIAATQWISHYVATGNKDSTNLARSAMMLGIVYESQKLSPLAEMQFRQSLDFDSSSLAIAGMGWINAEQGRWSDASQLFITAAHFETDALIVSQYLALTDHIRVSGASPRYSPILSAVLSTVFPGAGQVYADHIADGLQAFLAVATFSLATWSAWRYENDHNGPYYGTASLGVITLTLHSANIWGGWRTAKYRNMRQDELTLNPIREAMLETELALPPP